MHFNFAGDLLDEKDFDRHGGILDARIDILCGKPDHQLQLRNRTNGWTVNPFSNGNTQVVVYSGNYGYGVPMRPEDETYAAAFGGGGSVTGEIAQEFATTPGAVYSGSLYYAGAGAANDGYVQVTLGDATTETPILISPQLQPLFSGTWSKYSFQFTATMRCPASTS